jgi:hypothetical protein
LDKVIIFTIWNNKLNQTKLQSIVLSVIAGLIVFYISKRLDNLELEGALNFFTLNVSLPVWSLILIFALFFAVTYIGFLSNRISKFRKDLTPKDIELRYRTAQYVSRTIVELGTKGSKELIGVLESEGICQKDIADEVISDMFQESILIKESNLGYRMAFGHKNKIKSYFKP